MIALWWTMTGWAGVLHVEAGATGGDGSASAPFGEIQDALDAAQPGDVIAVGPGVYGAIATVRDGAADARIRVTADPAGAAVVQAAGTALRGAHPYHTFDGLVFDGGYGGGDVLVMGGSDHLVLRGVEVRRAYGGDCIDLRDAADVRIEGSWIHHCVNGAPGSLADSHGITGDGVFDLSVVDTEVALVSGDAVQLSPSRVAWDGLVIERCRLWSGALDEDAGPVPAGTRIGENALDTKVGTGLPRVVVRDVEAWGWRGVIDNQGAFNVKEDVDALVERVSVWDAEIAFRLRHPARVEVRNAEVWDVDVAFRVEDGLDGARLAAVTVGPDAGAVFQDAGGEPVGIRVENLLHAAPLGESWPLGGQALQVGSEAFVDAAAGDLRLTDDSPAIDRGEALDGFADDRGGAPRPFGSAWDLGAWEWGAEAVDPGDEPTDSGTGAPDGGAAGRGEGRCGCAASPAAGGLWWLLGLVPWRRRAGRRYARLV